MLAQIWEALPQGQRYLLLDEPTTSLDLAHQHDTLHLVHDFARQGVGVLTILPDLNLAAQYADRVLILRSGRSLAWGPPPQVLIPPLIEAAFDIAVTVLPHPQLGCPLVVSTPEKLNRD